VLAMGFRSGARHSYQRNRVRCWPVRVLLPPSEAKTPGGRGRALERRDPDPVLGQARERVLDALAALLEGPRNRAAESLALPASVADDALSANRIVRSSPTMPALRRYAGVVYDGLSFGDLEPRAQRLAYRELVVFSGLFGAVRGDESVPDYRVPAKANLPGIGIAGTFWRPVLADALSPVLADHMVVDLRSSDYAAMWKPARGAAERVIVVRALSRLPSGAWGVISYNSKFAKGRLAAALVKRRVARRAVGTADDIAAAWEDATGLRAVTPSANRVEIYTDPA